MCEKKCSVGPPCNFIEADGGCNYSGMCLNQRPLSISRPSGNESGEDGRQLLVEG